jgi:hypothetical protein
VVQRELADEPDVEAAALGERVEDAGDAAQVDRVLHRAAADDDPAGDGPRGSRRDPVPRPQRLEDVHETGPVEQLADGNNSAAEHAQPARVQPAGEVLGEHRQPLLGLVVTRQPDRQQFQGLPGAVVVGDDVGADLVVQQRLDPVGPDRGRLGDQQPAERHHQFGDVVAHVDAHREVRIDGAVALELSAGRVRERTGGDAAGAGRLRRDRLEQLLRGGRERRGDSAVQLQRSVHIP